MIRRKHSSVMVRGMLLYEAKKILLRTEGEDFFVRDRRIPNNLLHGDQVIAKKVKSAESSRLAEVEIIRLEKRTEKVLLGKRKGKFLEPLAGMGTLTRLRLDARSQHFPEGVLLEWSVVNGLAHTWRVFQTDGRDDEVATILFSHQLSSGWNEDIRQQERQLQDTQDRWCESDRTPPVNTLLSHMNDLENATKYDHNAPWFQVMESEHHDIRYHFGNWYTLTIDGADARDLDDAVSIAHFQNGDILLGVHIADVSHFVEEKTAIDREAFLRGTSTYLPEEVIPMLPETLSNHLCSLHPDTEKYTLSCLMRIHPKTGRVFHTDIVRGIIVSRHRGVYDSVFQCFQDNALDNEAHGITLRGLFHLYEILKKRRKKEGKIAFETTELSFGLTPE